MASSPGRRHRCSSAGNCPSFFRVWRFLAVTEDFCHPPFFFFSAAAPETEPEAFPMILRGGILFRNFRWWFATYELKKPTMVGASAGEEDEGKRGEKCLRGRSPFAFIWRPCQSGPSVMPRCHVTSIWATTWQQDTNRRPPVYSACAGIEGMPLLRSDIRAHGVVTPRSKAGSGPRYVKSHPLLCAGSQCGVMSSVTSLALSHSFESSTGRHEPGYNQVEYLLGMPGCLDHSRTRTILVSTIQKQ